jgi:hypothetical protein
MGARQVGGDGGAQTGQAEHRRVLGAGGGARKLLTQGYRQRERRLAKAQVNRPLARGTTRGNRFIHAQRCRDRRARNGAIQIEWASYRSLDSLVGLRNCHDASLYLPCLFCLLC